jgi:hypothetical protein
MTIRAVALTVAALALGAADAPAQTTVPAIHFHVGAEELMQTAYPVRSGEPIQLADDVRWVQGRGDDLVEWWERQGPAFLARASAYVGLPWPYRDIEVYLVRTWPVISIEYPLVLALGAVEGGGGVITEIPDDEDFQVLLLAHQITHYLLDDPTFVPQRERPGAYDHRFLSPGDLEVEAMVNWVLYAVLEELWGARRLERTTEHELWQAYNPNHAYVVDELVPRWRLSPSRTLAAWLAANPEGSEIFRVREAYRRQRAAPETTPAPGENLSGTPYGIDLGASFDGKIFIAFVDRASPADRAGLRQGDILLTIEGRPVGRDVVDAQARLDASWEDDGEVNLSVERGGREEFITVERR